MTSIGDHQSQNPGVQSCCVMETVEGPFFKLKSTDQAPYNNKKNRVHNKLGQKIMFKEKI